MFGAELGGLGLAVDYLRVVVVTLAVYLMAGLCQDVGLAALHLINHVGVYARTGCLLVCFKELFFLRLSRCYNGFFGVCRTNVIFLVSFSAGDSIG